MKNCCCCDLPMKEWESGLCCADGDLVTCPECVDWKVVMENVRVAPEMFTNVSWFFLLPRETGR